MAPEVKESTYRLQLQCGPSIFVRDLTRQKKDCSQGYKGDAPDDYNDRGSARERGLTMVVVHGGPGLSDHTETYPGLRLLITDEHDDDCHHVIDSMVFYDQLGCGRSDRPSDCPHLFTLSRYVDELREVVLFVSSRLHPRNEVCILGHSWGGQLALELLLRDEKASGNGSCDVDVSSLVRCAVISNSPLNELSYESKQRELRSKLDDLTRQFYEVEEDEKASDGSVPSMIYRRLIGVRETEITGGMAGWSVLGRLNELSRPCLFVSGDDDTVPHEEYESLKNVEWEGDIEHQVLLMKGGGHGPFFGRTAGVYFSAILDFCKSTQPRP